MNPSNHHVAGLTYGEPARRAIASYDNYAEAEAAARPLPLRFDVHTAQVHPISRARPRRAEDCGLSANCLVTKC